MRAAAFIQRYEFPADGVAVFKGKRWRALPQADKKNAHEGHALQDLLGGEKILLTHASVDRLIKEKLLTFLHGKNAEQSVTHKRVRQSRDFEKYSKSQTDAAAFKKRILFYWDQLRGPNPTREDSEDAIQAAHDAAFAEANARALKNGTSLKPFKTRSLATLYAWKSELANVNGAARILVDQREEHSGNTASRLTMDQENILDLALQRWLTTDHKSAVTVFEQLEADIDAMPEYAHLRGVDWPHINTFHARKRMLGQADRDYYRLGAEYFQKAYHSTGVGIGPTRPGMMLQIDGMELDVQTICGTLEEYRKLGRKERRALNRERVTVVAIIDVATRSIVGFAIGLSESTKVAKRALRMGFSDKTELAAAAGCKSDYPQRASGGARIVSDNGSGFLEEFTASVLDTYSVHQKAVVGVPWLRAQIERFFRTLAHRFFQIFTGRVFGPVKGRNTTQATLFTHQLPRLFTRYVVDVYHHTTHRGIGLTPYTAWRLLSEASPPPPPMSDERLSAIFGEEEVVPVGPDGIEINGFQYHSMELQDVFEYLGVGAEVTIRHDAEDVGQIAVRLPKDYVRQHADEKNGYDPEDLLWISVPNRSGLRGVPIFAAEKVSNLLLQEYGATPEMSSAIARAGKAYLHQISREMKLAMAHEEDVSPGEQKRLRRTMHPGLLQLTAAPKPPDLSRMRMPHATGSRAHELDGLSGGLPDTKNVEDDREWGELAEEPVTRVPKPSVRSRQPDPIQISVIIPKGTP